MNEVFHVWGKVLHYCIRFGDTDILTVAIWGGLRIFLFPAYNAFYTFWCIVLEVLTRKLILSFEAFIQTTFKWVFYCQCFSIPYFSFTLLSSHFIYVKFLIQDIALLLMKTVLAPKVIANVKCNRKLEQRAIQLQSLHTMNKSLKHHMEKFTWWLFTCSTVDF